jgi:hypothetical protein
MIPGPERLLTVLLALLMTASLLSGCAEGAPGTPGTASTHLNGETTFFAGMGGSH